jgi:tight adherence protein B
MGGDFIVVLTGVTVFAGLAGAIFAFSETQAAPKKRLAAVSRTSASAASQARAALPSGQQRRKSVEILLKDLERQKGERNKRPTLKRRISQAGLQMSPRLFWTVCGAVAVLTAFVCLMTRQSALIASMAGFAAGFGFPRWVLHFLKKRRQKKFTNEFANAIDVIVRSVKTGLPVNEALKIVAKEIPEPVRGEFSKLCEGLRLGVTIEQGVKRMYDNMPTAEVNFFAIVMTVQLKSGGNLSEALGNLSAVLRDRKRLQGKIKALSAEAKASAMIIGALPPCVMLIVWFSTPTYIEPLFMTRLGNLLLAGCVVWMGIGVFIMKKMISFKH